MSLITTIKKDKIAAMKAKDTALKSALTTLIGEIEIIGKNDGNRETTNEEALKVITKFKKGVLETMEFVKKGPSDKAQELKLIELWDESLIYDQYLPQMMTEAELKAIIVEYKEDGIDTMGIMMKALKEHYAGKYDGRMASTICKEVL